MKSILIIINWLVLQTLAHLLVITKHSELYFYDLFEQKLIWNSTLNTQLTTLPSHVYFQNDRFIYLTKQEKFNFSISDFTNNIQNCSQDLNQQFIPQDNISQYYISLQDGEVNNQQIFADNEYFTLEIEKKQLKWVNQTDQQQEVLIEISNIKPFTKIKNPEYQSTLDIQQTAENKIVVQSLFDSMNIETQNQILSVYEYQEEDGIIKLNIIQQYKYKIQEESSNNLTMDLLYCISDFSPQPIFDDGQLEDQQNQQQKEEDPDKDQKQLAIPIQETCKADFSQKNQMEYYIYAAIAVIVFSYFSDFKFKKSKPSRPQFLKKKNIIGIDKFGSKIISTKYHNKELVAKRVYTNVNFDINDISEYVQIQNNGNFVQIEGIEKFENKIWVFQEKILCSLQDLITNKQKYDEICQKFKGKDEFIKYIAQTLLETLKSMAQNKITLNNLKPSNIYLDQNYKIKIDVPIENIINQNHLKNNNQYYLPLEAIKQQNSENDIFALGCTLYQLYENGVHPFKEQSFNNIQQGVNCVQSQNLEFNDLIESMIQQNNRIKVQEAINHVYLMNSKKRTELINNLYSKISQNYKDFNQYCNHTKVLQQNQASNKLQNVKSGFNLLETLKNQLNEKANENIFQELQNVYPNALLQFFKFQTKIK